MTDTGTAWFTTAAVSTLTPDQTTVTETGQWKPSATSNIPQLLHHQVVLLSVWGCIRLSVSDSVSCVCVCGCLSFLSVRHWPTTSCWWIEVMHLLQGTDAGQPSTTLHLSQSHAFLWLDSLKVSCLGLGAVDVHVNWLVVSCWSVHPIVIDLRGYLLHGVYLHPGKNSHKAAIPARSYSQGVKYQCFVTAVGASYRHIRYPLASIWDAPGFQLPPMLIPLRQYSTRASDVIDCQNLLWEVGWSWVDGSNKPLTFTHRTGIHVPCMTMTCFLTLTMCFRSLNLTATVLQHKHVRRQSTPASPVSYSHQRLPWALV